jgi:hypothetical protein
MDVPKPIRTHFETCSLGKLSLLIVKNHNQRQNEVIVLVDTKSLPQMNDFCVDIDSTDNTVTWESISATNSPGDKLRLLMDEKAIPSIVIVSCEDDYLCTYDVMDVSIERLCSMNPEDVPSNLNTYLHDAQCMTCGKFVLQE